MTRTQSQTAKHQAVFTHTVFWPEMFAAVKQVSSTIFQLPIANVCWLAGSSFIFGLPQQ
jgi:hypothetical protein